MSGGHLLCAGRSGTETALRRRGKRLSKAARRRRRSLRDRGSCTVRGICVPWGPRRAGVEGQEYRGKARNSCQCLTKAALSTVEIPEIAASAEQRGVEVPWKIEKLLSVPNQTGPEYSGDSGNCCQCRTNLALSTGENREIGISAEQILL